MLKRRYLPTTKALFSLRNSVLSAMPNVEQKHEEEDRLPPSPPQSPDIMLFSKLKSLRKKTLDIVVGETPLAGAIPSFFQAWEMFAELPEDHIFYLPPLYYRSKDLLSILHTSLECILNREAKRIYDSDSNTGHLVLGGVEGAGKTTLLRALALGTAALLERMVPIAHDFLVFKIPSKIISDAVQVYHNLEEVLNDPLDYFQGRDQDVLLLLDEFQHVFRFTDNPHWTEGKQAAEKVHRYSRSYGTYGVIGGSSIDMHSLMFKSGADENTDYWRKLGFPDFNGSLYNFKTMPALRTTTELLDYINVRYPIWELTEIDVAQILEYTGEIGRWVHDVWCGCKFELEMMENKIGLSVEVLKKKTAFRKVPPERFVEKEDNRQLIVYLSLCGAPSFDHSRCLVSVGCVERSALLSALKLAGVSSPTSLLDSAQAESVVYFDVANSIVQFSRPVDFKIYRSNLPPAMHKFLLVTAVHFMVKGVAGDDVTQTDVNAGNALEELVRGGVFRATIDEDVIFEGHKLVIVEGALCLRGEQSVVRLNEESLLSLNKKHLSWQKEHGLDGLCFTREEAKGKVVWWLDAWQCKGGRHDVEIGGGNGSMQTALGNYNKNYRLQDVGDKQVTEILLKAQVGICMLVKALNVSLPTVIVKPRKLVITTTKKCSKACSTTLDMWNNSKGVMIENDLLAHFELSSMSSLKSRFRVQIVAGCIWVIRCIPETEPLVREMAFKLLPQYDQNHAADPHQTSDSFVSQCTIH